ncbi:MAG: hypothetical protein MHMPM18_003236, partial [Marteilia pararefringens]
MNFTDHSIDHILGHKPSKRRNIDQSLGHKQTQKHRIDVCFRSNPQRGIEQIEAEPELSTLGSPTRYDSSWPSSTPSDSLACPEARLSSDYSLCISRGRKMGRGCDQESIPLLREGLNRISKKEELRDQCIEAHDEISENLIFAQEFITSKQNVSDAFMKISDEEELKKFILDKPKVCAINVKQYMELRDLI